MTASSDSTAVRDGEELDLAALNGYLREHLTKFDPSSPIEIKQFPGGHSISRRFLGGWPRTKVPCPGAFFRQAG